MQEHEFAPFVRTLGRGKKGVRDLDEHEAYSAMRMILDGRVLPIQLGAFLMLMRMKEETGTEVAGFVRAARETFTSAESPAIDVDVDWSAYAGKRRHLPWFVLSALLLASHDFRVFMHGTEGYDSDRVYAPQALAALGVPACESLAAAQASLDCTGFAFMSLRTLVPTLHELMQLRPVLGLRSPVHTVARSLNPLNAPVMLQGIVHPGYFEIHREAALRLGVARAAVIKGEGGEFERRPDRPSQVRWMFAEEALAEEWPALLEAPMAVTEEPMDLSRLAAVWHGRERDAYGEAAVIGTAAVALKAMEAETTQAAAEALARHLWSTRQPSWLEEFSALTRAERELEAA